MSARKRRRRITEAELNGDGWDGITEEVGTAIPAQSGSLWDPPGDPSLAAVDMGGNGHQGDFGEQFVATLAIAANLDIMKSSFRDRTGVDWTLCRSGASGRARFPKIEVQVKCWSKPKSIGAEWRYPLPVHNYNLLAGKDYDVPRFLFLVVVPPKWQAWVDVGPQAMVVRQAAYWACFHDAEPLPDRPAGSSHTVSVPHANLLDVDSLHSLFGESHREGLMAP